MKRLLCPWPMGLPKIRHLLHTASSNSKSITAPFRVGHIFYFSHIDNKAYFLRLQPNFKSTATLTMVALVAVTTAARLWFPNVFKFNCGVEFLFTSSEGESHGRFISVIGE